MKKIALLICLILSLYSCSEPEKTGRTVEDFNANWKFNLGDFSNAEQLSFNDDNWKLVKVPHDWSIEEGYQKENTAASTGFVPGGMGWYRKDFNLDESDKGKHISIAFDGVYNNSTVWVNGHLLGTRPNGYSSFSYDLSPYLHYGKEENTIAVKVDHTAYVDSRWYTGSGIYRKVQLIKKAPLHIKQWGVQITTPVVKTGLAEIHIATQVNFPSNAKNEISIVYEVFNQQNESVASKEVKTQATDNNVQMELANPIFWSLEKPHLYTLQVAIKQNGKLLDNTSEKFGVRTINFDSNTGFSLNGNRVKIKGVNLHHDAGAVGAAVPKAIWEYRINQLKSIGVNAIRLSHNPHSIELLEVCDEKGMLVMDEAFDEWHVPKGKSLVYLGDNAAPKEAAKAYPEHFKVWAERDLKDLIKRDFNHPSVVMWSIGNEIEWTFGDYSKTYAAVNGKNKADGYHRTPSYDSIKIKKAFDKITKGVDPLAATAKKLVAWVKEIDTSRPVTCGSVQPSIGMVSGYGQAVDVFGFNYRAADYDAAHKRYPNLKIIGSENWCAYSEWKNVVDRDFVSGIFLWTGFAYMGEAGPWPRKGLNISLFDYAGFKNPRGHFFECLWKNDPKVYAVTTPASESEFSFDKKEGWKFDIQYTAPPVWKMLRKWEWYKVYEKWSYKEKEQIVVQTYTNCEEAELFLNGKSLGKQKRSAYSEDDNIIKWMVPFAKGELKVIGYNHGQKADEFVLNTPGKFSKIILESNKVALNADGYDVAVLTAKLVDEANNLITDADVEIEFYMTGAVKNIGIDNGWEKNVQNHQSNKIVTHKGKAIILLQSTSKKENASVEVRVGTIKSNLVNLAVE
ncbi:sugar-binding domain-containing protein [Flavicella sediminum]|uniref:sugar-binding domain-containing protein n=1 Tax=Flavicella sediminum TaxID=2585141 RepID=UPI0011247E9C|nr:sugar-binding domain-containing protein [Flavicella sediminum]